MTALQKAALVLVREFETSRKKLSQSQRKALDALDDARRRETRRRSSRNAQNMRKGPGGGFCRDAFLEADFDRGFEAGNGRDM